MQNSLYDIIISPIITEKATMAAEAKNKTVFLVRKDATKPLIKKAVEEIFGVKVTDVNTITIKGKVKRFRGTVGRRSDYKKAEVTLAEGSKIDNVSGEV